MTHKKGPPVTIERGRDSGVVVKWKKFVHLYWDKFVFVKFVLGPTGL